MKENDLIIESINNNKKIIIIDKETNNELTNILKNNNYNTFTIDLINQNEENSYNIYSDIINNYKEGKKLNALIKIKEMNQLFIQKNENQDPFFYDCAENLLNGITLYFILNNEEFTIKDIYSFTGNAINNKELITPILSSTNEDIKILIEKYINMPEELLKSILMIINEKLEICALCKTINNTKTKYNNINAFVIIKGDNKVYDNIVSIIISQINFNKNYTVINNVI